MIIREEVQEMVCEMKTEKATRLDGCVAECLRSGGTKCTLCAEVGK